MRRTGVLLAPDNWQSIAGTSLAIQSWASILVAGIALAGNCPLTTAATINNWSAGGAGSWNIGSNWSTGNIPAIIQDANIVQSANAPASPFSVTLDANQTAYGLTLNPLTSKAAHIDPGTSATNTLTLLSADPTTADGVSKFVSINVEGGSGNQINAPLQLGNGVSGSLVAVISSSDPSFTINGGISESPLGQTWGVEIVGNSQGVVHFANTPDTYSGDTTIASGGVLRVDSNNIIPSQAGKGNVVLQGNGILQLGDTSSQLINGLSSSSSMAMVAKTIGKLNTTLTLGNNNATSSYAGSITNPNETPLLNLMKTGTGTQTLSGVDSYRGSTTVSGGTLLVDGTHNSAGGYSVNASAATLGGTGTINSANANSVVTITSGGVLDPGDNGPGVLNVHGTLTLTTTGRLSVELGGVMPGDGPAFYDQVNMTSSTNPINTQAARLSVSFVNGFLPQPNNIFYILTRADFGAFPLNQPFDAINEGNTINLGNGVTAKVTYRANWTGSQATSTLTGGNDMALFDIVVPEPMSAILFGLGMLAFVAIRKQCA